MKNDCCLGLRIEVQDGGDEDALILQEYLRVAGEYLGFLVVKFWMGAMSMIDVFLSCMPFFAPSSVRFVLLFVGAVFVDPPLVRASCSRESDRGIRRANLQFRWDCPPRSRVLKASDCEKNGGGGKIEKTS